ncbi:MAG TPA: PAS domain-containing protein, partial [Steroidobacteraceae bacterium]|nr:PAS domain-containing protein [Steroidobacteraceae bacterium]
MQTVQVLASRADNDGMQHAQSGSESSKSVPGPASWSLDLTTGELRSSPHRARMLGLDPAGVVATAEWWDRTVHPEDRVGVAQARSQHLRDGGSGYRCEYRAQRQDGEWLWLLEVGCIERGPAGAPQRVDGVLLDVTAERGARSHAGQEFYDLADAQQALRKLEHRLAVAESSANLGLWEVDIESGTGWANDQYFVMLGYQPREFQIDLKTLMSMIHPDDLPSALVLSNDLDSLAELRSEFRMRAKDGSWRWIHTVGRPLTDSQGRQRMAGVHLDVTERKEAELRRHAAERLESVGKLAAGVAHEINTPVQFVSDSIYFVRDGLHELLALTDRLRALASRDQCNISSVAALSTHLPYLIENLPNALERS